MFLLIISTKLFLSKFSLKLNFNLYKFTKKSKSKSSDYSESYHTDKYITKHNYGNDINEAISYYLTVTLFVIVVFTISYCYLDYYILSSFKDNANSSFMILCKKHNYRCFFNTDFLYFNSFLKVLSNSNQIIFEKINFIFYSIFKNL